MSKDPVFDDYLRGRQVRFEMHLAAEKLSRLGTLYVEMMPDGTMALTTDELPNDYKGKHHDQNSS